MGDTTIRLPSCVKISCDIENPAVDQLICIKIEGAKLRQPITVTAVVQENGQWFGSFAYYKSNENGEVDFSQDASVGGHYIGEEPMGLFWSMDALPGQSAGLRLMKWDVTKPLHTQLSVYEGHVNPLLQSAPHQPISHTTVDRWYKTSHVDRIPIQDRGFVGTLFVPHGDGPFPGVIDLFGTIGNLVETRAALLASHGFVTLAVAYYLPKKTIFHHDLSYFEKAVDFLVGHPKVIKHGVGVIGVSKGADLALSMATYLTKVKAAIAINGYPSNTLLDLTYKEELLLAAAIYSEHDLMIDNGTEIELVTEISMTPSNLIPVEKGGHDTYYMVIHCEDDKSYVNISIEKISNRLAQHGLSCNFESVLYPRAGHLLEPPHSPLFDRSFHPLFNSVIIWGGEKIPHARAQEDSWRRMQQFLRKHLSVASADSRADSSSRELTKSSL